MNNVHIGISLLSFVLYHSCLVFSHRAHIPREVLSQTVAQNETIFFHAPGWSRMQHAGDHESRAGS